MSEKRERIVLALQLTLLFVVVYFGTNQFAVYRHTSRSLAFEWESSIPAIGIFWVSYLSIFFVAYAPVVYLDWKHLVRFAYQCAYAILISGVIFLIWPNILAYERSPETAVNVFGQMVRALDQPYNTFPSLHVSLATLCAAHLVKNVSRRKRWIIGVWLVVTYFSVLFTHQHHIGDVFGGLFLAFVLSSEVRQWFFSAPQRIVSPVSS